jgi:uncharacterized protein
LNTRIVGGLSLGFGTGILAGMVGVGGGLLIVPALVYFFNMDQHTAQGTSLAVLLPPTGLFAFMQYYKAGHVDMVVAMMIATGVLLGGYFGGAWAQHLPEPVLRKTFAIIMALAALKMFFQK